MKNTQITKEEINQELERILVNGAAINLLNEIWHIASHGNTLELDLQEYQVKREKDEKEVVKNISQRYFEVEKEHRYSLVEALEEAIGSHKKIVYFQSSQGPRIEFCLESDVYRIGRTQDERQTIVSGVGSRKIDFKKASLDNLRMGEFDNELKEIAEELNSKGKNLDYDKKLRDFAKERIAWEYINATNSMDGREFNYQFNDILYRDPEFFHFPSELERELSWENLIKFKLKKETFVHNLISLVKLYGDKPIKWFSDQDYQKLYDSSLDTEYFEKRRKAEKRKEISRSIGSKVGLGIGISLAVPLVIVGIPLVFGMYGIEKGYKAIFEKK